MKNSLLRKYNVPGPRYTSYPTVPYWETTPTAEQWLSALSQSIHEATRTQTGAAVYVHIPFCESLCTYCGCNTRITRNRAVTQPYLNTVLKEWTIYREEFRKRDVVGEKMLLGELHLGGGTPTYATPAELDQFLKALLFDFELTSDPELSIEVDPRVTHLDHLQVLAQNGFKRISMGIQDFDPKVQEIVHRIQSEEQVDQLTKAARAQGFTSVNYDLIYGLPLQTIESINGTIDAVIRLRPDRIAFYGYAHVPWIKAGQRRFTESDLPSGDEKRALYERGRELLEAAGYIEIGMDHFALATDSLFEATQKKTLHRNFMGYTARNVSPILGLGVSSIGDAWSAFAQNEKLLETYSARVEAGEIPIYRGHVLTEEDQILRRHILNLMTGLETSWADAHLNTPFLDSIRTRLEEPARDGLITLNENGCRVHEAGRALLRNICMAFDARLTAKAPETRLFSQTV